MLRQRNRAKFNRRLWFPLDEHRGSQHRTSVQRLLETVPLSDDERTAAEGDRNAVDRFIGKLEDKVTLDGRTRREIEATSLVEREAMKPVLQRSSHPST